MVFQWLTNRKENCVVRETFFFIAVITIVNLIKSSKSIKKIPNWLYAKPQQPNRINNVLYIIIIIIQQLIYYFITLLQLALFTLNTNQLLLKNCYARSVFFFSSSSSMNRFAALQSSKSFLLWNFTSIRLSLFI